MKIDQIRITPEEEQQDHATFVIEPLEQGYGQTIGNSLRRVLLTSLTGAAITQIKIDGVAHQFSTIKGMAEDVTELILNLKQVSIRLEDKNRVVGRLRAKGPGKVSAGDIELPAEASVVNTDLHLATLDKGGSLQIEIVVERGEGYSNAEERPSDEIGVIPVDALYSPVVRVNYTVDATRVGRITNYDKLTLEIHTDGTKTPSEALQEAGKILVDHFTLFVHPDQAKTAQPTTDRKRDAVRNQLIEELDLPVRLINSLKAAEIETIGQLVDKRKEDLAKVRNLGGKSVVAVEKALAEKGLTFTEGE